MASANICEWTASLYDDKSRGWRYGSIGIIAADIIFTPTEGQTNSTVVAIPFVDIVDIKKSTTGLVFGALYVVTKDNKKYWFSSLPDRSGIFGALNHFWKAQLFIQDGNSKASVRKGQTERGQKLLSIVQDSEDSLKQSAEQFYNQGRQLDHALNTMDDLHNDLDVAENFVSDLESWFGRWRLPEEYQSVDPIFINKSEIPDVFQYEVIFNKVQTNRLNLRQVGSITISKDGITIMKMKMKTEYHFTWSDVSEIRVLTPWEIMIIRYQIGKADLKYSLVSANMAAVLRLLDRCARYKLKYDTPPEMTLCTNHSKQWETAQINTTHDEARNQLVGNGPVQTTFYPSEITVGVTKLQINQSEEVVSEMEANEISRRLEGLKSLAVGIQVEGNEQLEKIESLTNAVDTANIRLQHNQKRINKLS